MLINCDMGEGLDNDAQLMPCLDLANIACGAHAGDRETMRSCIALAMEHGVQVGAHIGFADKEHFGRREINLDTAALYALCVEQIVLMQEVCAEVGAELKHLKPHGALYTMMMRDDAVLCTIMRALKETTPGLQMLIMAIPDQNSYESLAAEYAVRLLPEAFVDRTYAADGLLSSRQEPGACHEDVASIMQQAESLLYKKSVRTVDGTDISVIAETLCIHGDNPLALESAQQLRALLS